eukprot:391118_1
MLVFSPGKIAMTSRLLLKTGIAVVIVGFPDVKKLFSRIRFIIYENKNKSLNLDKFQLSTSSTINVQIDVNDIKNVLLTTGTIQSGDVPLPPIIEIKEIKSDSAVIMLNPVKQNQNVTKSEEHKLEYAEYDGDSKNNDDDDMKLEWKTVTMNENTKKYEIKSLKISTNYCVHAA